MKNTAETEYIQKLIEHNTPVCVFTINGYRLYGNIINQDDVSFTVQTVDRDGYTSTCMLYKHAVSTITPKDSYFDRSSKF